MIELIHLFVYKHSPWGRSTSTSHSAWSLKGQKKIWTICDLLLRAYLHFAYAQQFQLPSSLNIKKTPPYSYFILHTREKRNKWLHDYVMMISLLAQGNYVTMAMWFPPELRGGIMRQEVGGLASYWRSEENRGLRKEAKQHIPCYPLAALFTYVKRRWLVSQGNRKSWIYTHLQIWHRQDHDTDMLSQTWL